VTNPRHSANLPSHLEMWEDQQPCQHPSSSRYDYASTDSEVCSESDMSIADKGPGGEDDNLEVEHRDELDVWFDLPTLTQGTTTRFRIGLRTMRR
jgi:hypothetical protein